MPDKIWKHSGPDGGVRGQLQGLMEVVIVLLTIVTNYKDCVPNVGLFLQNEFRSFPSTCCHWIAMFPARAHVLQWILGTGTVYFSMLSFYFRWMYFWMLSHFEYITLYVLLIKPSSVPAQRPGFIWPIIPERSSFSWRWSSLVNMSHDLSWSASYVHDILRHMNGSRNMAFIYSKFWLPDDIMLQAFLNNHTFWYLIMGFPMMFWCFFI